MEIRLITVRDDFEKAFKLLDHQAYPLSFYEYFLKHDLYSQNDALKLIGLFDENECIGTISYRIKKCQYLGRILEINEIHHKGIKAYKKLMDFLDVIASEESCNSIKICKNKAERMNYSIFDRMENYFKNLSF